MAILVVTKTPAHAVSLFDWAWRLAQSRRESLTVIALEKGSEERTTPVDLRQTLPDGSPDILKTLRAKAETHPEPFDDDPETPPLFVRHLQTANPGAKVLEEADRIDASLVIVRGRRSHDQQDGSLGQHLYVHCHRALMVVTGSAEGMPKRILVPTAEGCHTQEALHVAHSVVTESDGELTALYVQLPTEHPDHGEQVLEEALRQAGLDGSERVVRRVESAQSLEIGVLAAKEEHDAVFCGAPRRGDPKKPLLDLLPTHLIDQDDGRLAAVLRSRRSYVERFVEAFDRMVHLWVPQMDREHRKSIYQQLEEQSEWGFDFKMLMALSTCIASFGLIQNSTAVVIGAMLVAPLMTPMLCAGMALQQGNQHLLINNAKAITGGFLTALSVAFVVGLISFVQLPTEEMMGRGKPTLLDLGVALVSGFAAAYAFSRGEKLAAMLPGVAIAAALVPPIATTGVCLSLVVSTSVRGLFGPVSHAIATDSALMGAGAALLFLTNVVAIILGASLAFYSFGIRRWDPEPWVRRVLQGLVITVAVLAIPLSAILWDTMKRNVLGLSAEMEAVVEAHEAYSFRSVHWIDDALEVTLRGPEAPNEQLVAQLRRYAVRQYGPSVKMHVITETAVTSTGDRGDKRHLGTLRTLVKSVLKDYPSYTFLELTRQENTIQIGLRGSAAPSTEFMDALRTVVQKREGPSVGLRVNLVWSFTSD